MNKNRSNAQTKQTDDQAEEMINRTGDQGIASGHSEEKRKLRRAINKAELDLSSVDNGLNNNP